MFRGYLEKKSNISLSLSVSLYISLSLSPSLIVKVGKQLYLEGRGIRILGDLH